MINTITLPALALRGLVLFPGVVMHFDVGRDKSLLAVKEAMEKNQHIYIISQKDLSTDNPELSDLFSVGVVAEIKQVIKTQNNNMRVLVEGKYRAKTVSMVSTDPFLVAEIKENPVKGIRSADLFYAEALVRSVKLLFEDYANLLPKMPKEILMKALDIEEPNQLCEFIVSNIMLKVAVKQQLLEMDNPIKRLEQLAKVLEQENSYISMEQDIFERVYEQMEKNNRDYFLREQLKIISSELGDSDNPKDIADEYRKKILALHLREESQEKLLKETDRLLKTPAGSHEGAVIRSYLDTCLSLPFNHSTKDNLDIKRAQKILDKEHYGLKKVKERILESLAVRSLNPDFKGQILCLAGPPGTGKTSIAKSIAKSMGRKYIRISLGGVRDEADIRGHRKTYVGAMPGRIVNALISAKVKNPLILLDEIDKMSSDFRGDPSSAMLEVLDSEQNFAFVDHYTEIPFDLSQVFFVTTANMISAIPAPLLDRMDVIELTTYTRDEKWHIAKKHLFAKQLAAHGLTRNQLKITSSAFYSMIDHYTRESGVRNLERAIATVCRKASKQIVEEKEQAITVTSDNLKDFLGVERFFAEENLKTDEIGVATGLAYTSVGGETMQLEVSVLSGSGKVELTGSLGDVMKESARTAVSFVRSVAGLYGIEEDFYKTKDIHIHVPEGAVPKDGPSAGITIATALVSALSSIPVKSKVAMTGEITLRGRVLPIGGLKEKTTAAYAAGIKTVIIPKKNEVDIPELDEVIRNNITFVPVKDMKKVLSVALVEFPKPLDSGKLSGGMSGTVHPDIQNRAQNISCRGMGL